MQGSRLFVSRMVKRTRFVRTVVMRSMFVVARTVGRCTPSLRSGVATGESSVSRSTIFTSRFRASAASFFFTNASDVFSSRSPYSTPATKACMA